MPKGGDFKYCRDKVEGLTEDDFSETELERFDFPTLEQQYFLDMFSIQEFDLDGFVVGWPFMRDNTKAELAELVKKSR